MSSAAPEAAPWPAKLPGPLELLRWLDAQAVQYRRQPEQLRRIAGLRWLVLAEVDRTAPERKPAPEH